MSMTVVATGTQTAVIGTTHTLYNPSPTVPGGYQLLVDRNAMLDGDVLELRALQMAISGGTARVLYRQTYANAPDPDDLIAVSVPISVPFTDNGAIQFTLVQTKGTGRNYPYSVVRVN